MTYRKEPTITIDPITGKKIQSNSGLPYPKKYSNTIVFLGWFDGNRGLRFAARLGGRRFKEVKGEMRRAFRDASAYPYQRPRHLHNFTGCKLKELNEYAKEYIRIRRYDPNFQESIKKIAKTMGCDKKLVKQFLDEDEESKKGFFPDSKESTANGRRKK